MTHTPQRVIVGLSGGVDSAVAALLLLEQGYEVQGLFMKNWEEDDTSDYCSADEDLADAQDVCDILGIPLHTRNFSTEYWDRVFEYFLAEYRVGRTPNPDILCNKEIKFKAFLEHSLDLGASLIATGHYARITTTNGEFQLLKGLDTNKDQSYFLYTLGQPPLSKSLFPLGEIGKPEVRAIATKAGFKNHAKKDSTGICFIGERKMREFLSRYLPAHQGEIQTADGVTVGQHHGLMYYTLGQRKGLGIGGHKAFDESPWYVAGKDLENNILLVTQGHDDPLLMSRNLVASKMDWVAGSAPKLPLNCKAKARYRQADQVCTISQHDADRFLVEFEHLQRAVTPGQSVVFYQGDQCLGGGIIESTDSALGILAAGEKSG